ncbi:MAG: HAD family hydrolase [Lachnospiraceae bacterium]|nr:HAD family hydrolase [Lachnospiraceae bacterium]
MVKGILFDKDGTLVDFFSLWLQAATEVIPLFLKENEIQVSQELIEYLLKTIGVNQGEIDPKGALAYKSYGEIAKDICDALEERKIYIAVTKAKEQIEEFFNQSVSSREANIQLFTDMNALMENLKSRNLIIGLATADTKISAENCLKSIGIEQFFDYIGADDGKRKPKPDKEMFLEFQNQFLLKPEEIAVVGDTYNDMLFAKQNGGIAIGVLSGVSEEEDFENEADYIIASIHELPELLDRI